EVASSNMNLRSAELAEKTARDYGLSVFTNSDAHAAEPLGRYGNDYAERLQTVDQLIRYVKKGVL
ncbi:MAG: PHP-associated domain-containing protein, partial [Desulfobacterales bacterium]